jgi:hypothetical protein
MTAPWPWSLEEIATVTNAWTGDVATGGNAGAFATWAMWTVDSLDYLIELDTEARGDLHTPRWAPDSAPHVIDTAHARWGTASAITAIDLCATCLSRRHLGFAGPREADLGSILSPKQFERLPQPARSWASNANTDQQYQTVLAARDALIHRRMERTFGVTIAVGADTADADRVALMLSDDVKILTPDLLATCRDVARRRVELFLDGVVRGDL